MNNNKTNQYSGNPANKQSLTQIKSVLVLGFENIIVLSVVRALGRILQHAKIHTLSPSDNRKPEWCSSKYVAQCHFFQSQENPTRVKELIECIQNTRADLVLPAGENYVRFLAEHQDKIRPHTLLPPLPTPELFDILVPKHSLNEYLIENGLPHPVNYHLYDTSLHNWDLESNPLLLKPVRGSSGTGMKKAGNLDELHQFIHEYNPDEYFFQEEIPGENIGCSFLAIDGEIKAYSIQKNLAKDGYNFSTAFEFVYQEEIYDATSRLVTCSGYNGMANLDYRLDERDGQAKLIDFNPRFWVSVLGSKAAGIDFTKLYCLAALGQPIEQQEYKKCIYLMGKSSLKYYGKRLLHPFSSKTSNLTCTDLWERMCDIRPELYRYIRIKS